LQKEAAELGITILGAVGLLTAIIVVPRVFFGLFIPAGAAQYLHFTQAEIILRAFLFVYSFAIAVFDSLIGIGLLLRNEKARKAALILSPAPLLGVILSSVALTGAPELGMMLMYTGVSFPALEPFLLVPVSLLNRGLFFNTTLWSYVIISLRWTLGILNLAMLLFLRNPTVRTIFQNRKLQEAQKM
jgi:hypothetical protein